MLLCATAKMARPAGQKSPRPAPSSPRRQPKEKGQGPGRRGRRPPTKVKRKGPRCAEAHPLQGVGVICPAGQKSSVLPRPLSTQADRKRPRTASATKTEVRLRCNRTLIVEQVKPRAMRVEPRRLCLCTKGTKSPRLVKWTQVSPTASKPKEGIQ